MTNKISQLFGVKLSKNGKQQIEKWINEILDIKENIWKNWNLTMKQKKEILKEIGLVE